MRYRTLDQIMAAGPCEDYPRARVQRLFAGRSRISNRAVARLDIPAADRLWALLVYMTPQEQRLFACDCAERALTRERKAGREPDKRSWQAIEVSRRYARGGATDEELATAESAARAAAWGAAMYAAMYAARAAAWGAAMYAAMYAVRAAAGAAWAAWTATRVTARAAECEWQIAHALEMMDAREGGE